MLDEPIGPLAAHYHTRGALYYILYGEATFNDAGITDDTLAQGEMRFVNSGVYYGPEEMDRSTSYVASVHEADPAGIDPAGAGAATQCPFACFNNASAPALYVSSTSAAASAAAAASSSTEK